MRSRCRDCHKERRLARYEGDRERERAAMRDYARRNAEAARQRKREWAARHVERERERKRAWKRAHPEAKALDNQRRRVGRDAEAVEYSVVLRADPCAYCGGPGGIVEHIVAVARGGGNGWENLTGACRSCNSTKGTASLLVGLLRLGSG